MRLSAKSPGKVFCLAFSRKWVMCFPVGSYAVVPPERKDVPNFMRKDLAYAHGATIGFARVDSPTDSLRADCEAPFVDLGQEWTYDGRKSLASRLQIDTERMGGDLPCGGVRIFIVGQSANGGLMWRCCCCGGGADACSLDDMRV